VRLPSDEVETVDALERIIELARVTSGDSVGASDVVTRSLASPRSVGDSSTTTDVVSYNSKHVRIVSDSSVDTDLGGHFVSLRRATGNDPLDPGNAVFPGSIFPGNQTLEMAESVDRGSRIVNLQKVAVDNSLSTDSESRGALHFVRVSSDSSDVTDVSSRGSLNFTRLASDLESTTDATQRGVISFQRTVTDSLPALDTNTVVRTLFRRGNDAAVFVTLTPLATVAQNMGYLIWATDAGNVLQQYTGKPLEEEPINELKVFEGRLFPRSGKDESDVFSYQLTSYPISVNTPHQTTTRT
jgi:hypothetical protein